MPDAAAAPTCLAVVLCDNILQDQETKKYYLMGTTTVMFARAFPARHQMLCIYVALTGIHRKTTITVKQVRIDPETADDTEILIIEGTVDAPDPLAVAELTLKLRHVVFPQQGEYRFQIWSGSTFLGERKLAVRPTPAPKERP
jgi:hypothetical protein